jgi:hypothetical protein
MAARLTTMVGGQSRGGKVRCNFVVCIFTMAIGVHTAIAPDQSTFINQVAIETQAA